MLNQKGRVGPFSVDGIGPKRLRCRSGKMESWTGPASVLRDEMQEPAE